MPESARPEPPRSRADLKWLLRASSAIGGVVVGLAVNSISDAYKGATAPAVGGVLLLVVVVSARLRQLPPQAPIQGLVSRIGLTGAGLAAVASILVSEHLRPWLVLIATALALIACLAPVANEEITIQLLGVAGIGLGVAGIGIGAGVLLESELLLGGAGIGVGVGVVGIGTSWLLESELLFGVAVIGVGVAGIGVGYNSLRGESRLRRRLHALITAPAEVPGSKPAHGEEEPPPDGPPLPGEPKPPTPTPR